MHFDAWLNLAVLIVGAIIAHAVKTPKDHERAALLKTLAESAAGVIVNAMPAAAWPRLLQATIVQISSEATLPTKNTAKIENAATSALVKLGKVAPETP